MFKDICKWDLVPLRLFLRHGHAQILFHMRELFVGEIYPVWPSVHLLHYLFKLFPRNVVWVGTKGKFLDSLVNLNMTMFQEISI